MLFESFIGLTVQEFNDIYDKEIAKRYGKYEIQRLSFKRNKDRKRNIGAGGRPFKLDLKNRVVMLLVYYYRLYITYTLTGFLFDLDQSSSTCRDIQKIEGLIRLCLPIPQKTYPITKRLKKPEEVEKYFQVSLLSQIIQNSKFQDRQIIEGARYTIQAKRKDIR
jgi:hypothetical protein